MGVSYPGFGSLCGSRQRRSIRRLKTAITKRMKEMDIPLTIKYIDPTYMIRSVPANAFDSQYCATLAQNAVHAAMAGYSGVTVGKVHERFVYLPIHAITNQGGRRVDVGGRWFTWTGALRQGWPRGLFPSFPAGGRHSGPKAKTRDAARFAGVHFTRALGPCWAKMGPKWAQHPRTMHYWAIL